ncbi:UNVERIFIED_CONTAM: hypothetical protein H355_015745 [Colinus virginianus]|nr:hypothetical protein H355_015745 [Colinus virginianus]
MSSKKLLSETRRSFPATKACCQQPSRILIVDVTSPSWANTCSVLSEALENSLCLACSLAGPCRIPLLSLYLVQNQQECLLPFVITILTSHAGKEIVNQLEMKLKDVDLVSLRRIQVIEVLKRDFLEPEDVEQCTPAEELSSNVCLKCDLQERLLDPALISGTTDGTMRTADLNSPCHMTAWPATVLYKLQVVKALKSEGVCESVLYGLPFIIKPTSCWQLDWDELELNQHSFHALCHSLLKRKWMLLAKHEPQNTCPSWNVVVHSYYVIVPSDSATLLVKPVAVRELLMPSAFPALLAEHPERAQGPIEHQSRARATVAPLRMAPSPAQPFRGRRDSCMHSFLPKEDEKILP